MRIVKTLLAAAIASSLVATPVLANAQKLSVTAAHRDAAPVGQEESAFGFSIILIIFTVVSFGFGLLTFTDIIGDDSTDEPVSP